jgi:hypothetical protein
MQASRGMGAVYVCRSSAATGPSENILINGRSCSEPFGLRLATLCSRTASKYSGPYCFLLSTLCHPTLFYSFFFPAHESYQHRLSGLRNLAASQAT